MHRDLHRESPEDHRRLYREDFSPSEARRLAENGALRIRIPVIAVRGERLALTRLEIGTADVSPGAPRDEMLQLYGIDEEGRVDLQVSFDIEDTDAAMAELDAAHARIERVHTRSPLENAATRADYRFNELFTERRWDEIRALLNDDIRVEDRRQGLRREGTAGATTILGEVLGIADLGVKSMTSDVIAIRGERLAILRTVYSGRDQRPDAFHTELLRIAEVDAEERITATISFDIDDFKAAIAELDARYLAGEAAAYSRTWSVVMQGFASLNRRELPPTTPDWVNIDHRRLGRSIASGEMPALLGAAWSRMSDLSNYIEAVHRLETLGAVMTHVTNETSQEGFHAEWRVISLITLSGDLVNRCEVYDEADIDDAIARFDQLNRPARLKNAASQAAERYLAHFTARDWDALAKVLADDISIDDRRRIVNAGIRHGRDAEIANLRATADAGFTYMTSVVIAARGERLILARASGRDRGSEEFLSEGLGVIEINSDNQIAAIVVFTPDDLDAAIAELDAATSPAKPPTMHTSGRSLRGATPRTPGTNFPGRCRTGSPSTTDAVHRSRPAT